MHSVSLAFTDAFVPEIQVRALEIAHDLDTFGRGQIEDVEAPLAEPDDAALGVDAVTDDHAFKLKLVDEAGAIPARSEGGHQDEVAVAGLAACGAEGVGFAVHGRVAVLYQAVAACAEQDAVGAEDGPADRDAAFGKSNASLFERDSEHRLRVAVNFHRQSVASANCLTQRAWLSRLSAPLGNRKGSARGSAL